MCCFYTRKCSKFFEQCNLKELIATCILNIISGLRMAVVVLNIEASDAGGEAGTHPTPRNFFAKQKEKKGKQRKRVNIFKAKTIKRLSPRSKCYSFCQSRASGIQEI